MNDTAAAPEGGCPIERTLSVVGRKWTMLVVRDLMSGPKRFHELEASLGCSPKILSLRLREMGRLGLVRRSVYPDVPVRVEYTLTDRGRSLNDVLQALARWGSTVA